MPKELSEEKRSQLDKIVSQMETNGEPVDNIKFVVNDFKEIHGVEKKSPDETTGTTKTETSSKDLSTVAEPLEESGGKPELAKLAPINNAPDYSVEISGSKPSESTIKPISEEKVSTAMSGAQYKGGPQLGKIKEGLYDFAANQLPANLKMGVASISEGLLASGEPGTSLIDYKDVGETSKEMKKSAIATKEVADANTAKLGLTQRIGDIKDPAQAIEYVFNTIGQAGVQIPAAIATFGTSSFLQEAGQSYYDNVRQIAKDMNITPGEVIDKGLDNAALSTAVGAVSGALDYVGAGKILKNIGKEGIARAIKSVVTEGVTEMGQGQVQEMGQIVGSDKRQFKELATVENLKRAGEDLAGGIVGGGGVTIAGNLASSKADVKDIEGRDEIISHSPETTNKLIVSSIENSPQIVEERLRQTEGPVNEENNSNQQPEVRESEPETVKENINEQATIDPVTGQEENIVSDVLPGDQGSEAVGGENITTEEVKPQESDIKDFDFKIKEETRSYKDNPNANWVRVSYNDGVNTYISGQSIDLWGSKEDAIGAAKNSIKKEIENGRIQNIDQQPAGNLRTEEQSSIESDTRIPVSERTDKSVSEKEPVSKWQKTFRNFTETFDPKEELKTYERITGDKLSKTATDLIEKKGPEYVAKSLNSLATGGKAKLTLDEQRDLVASGSILAQSLDKEYKRALSENDVELAKNALDERNKLVEDISYIGTKLGQGVKALDLAWLASFSDPELVLDSYAKGLSKQISDNIAQKNGEAGVHDKVEKAAKDITDKTFTQSAVNKARKASEKAIKDTVSSKEKPNIKLTPDRIDQATKYLENKLAELKEGRKGRPNDILMVVAEGYYELALESLIVGLKTYKNIRDSVKFATDKTYESWKKKANNGKEDLPMKRAMKDSIEKKAYETLGVEKRERKKRVLKDISEEDQAKLDEIEDTIEEIKEIVYDKEYVNRFKENINKLVDTDEEFSKLHTDITEDLKKLGIKDDKSLNKHARELLALIYMGNNVPNGMVQSAIASALASGKTPNLQAIAQANQFANQAVNYPVGSTKRNTLMAQAVQTIANTQPTSFIKVLLAAKYASMLSGITTPYNILLDNYYVKESKKNMFGGVPFVGRFLEKGRFIKQIYDNKYLGDLAKANLMNTMLYGDIRDNTLFDNVAKKGDLSRYMQSNPLGDSFYGKLLAAPLRMISSLDAITVPLLDKANQAQLLYKSLRNDPNNKRKSDTELLKEIKEGLNIFNEQKITDAKEQAKKEGYKEGDLPSKAEIIGNYRNVVIGRHKSSFTEAQRDAIDYNLRVAEILDLGISGDILKDAQDLTNRDLMRSGRKYTKTDSVGKKTKSGTSTTQSYESISELNEKYEKEIDDSLNKFGKIAPTIKRIIVNAFIPFAKTMMIGLSRKTDYIPGFGVYKAMDYKSKIGKNANPIDAIEYDKIWHRQKIGIATMITHLAVQLALAPSDDPEEFDKQPFCFITTGQLAGLDKNTRKAFKDQYGTNRIICFSYGKPIANIPYTNRGIATILDANAAMVGFLRAKDEIIEKDGEEFYDQATWNIAQYIAATASSLTSGTYNKSINGIFESLADASASRDGSKLVSQLGKAMGSTAVDFVSSGIAWSGLLKNIDGFINGKKPSNDVSDMMWSSVPMSMSFGITKPALDMFGKPITAYPGEGSNPLSSNLKILNPAHKPSEKERDIRNKIMFSGAIPSGIKKDNYEVILDKDGKEKEIKVDTYELTKRTGDDFYKWVMTGSGDVEDGKSNYDALMSLSPEELQDHIPSMYSYIKTLNTHEMAEKQITK